MKMDFQKIRERLGLSSDKPLTPEEKRRRARYIVYPFFCLLCAGFLLLVFSPSEKEALRVIKMMPKWKPGKQRGKAVRVKYTVPVTFKLQ
jgi:hypothetical protein